jgi:hypothetical protein
MNRAMFIVWNASAAVPSIGYLKDLSKNNDHFCELMDKREGIIHDLHVCRNELWDLGHTEKGYEKYTEKFIHEYGQNIIDRAEIFFHYLRGLHDSAKNSSRQAQKNKKVKRVRGRGNGETAQDASIRSDDVGQHMACAGDPSTDDARG